MQAENQKRLLDDLDALFSGTPTLSQKAEKNDHDNEKQKTTGAQPKQHATSERSAGKRRRSDGSVLLSIYDQLPESVFRTAQKRSVDEPAPPCGGGGGLTGLLARRGPGGGGGGGGALPAALERKVAGRALMLDNAYGQAKQQHNLKEIQQHSWRNRKRLPKKQRTECIRNDLAAQPLKFKDVLILHQHWLSYLDSIIQTCTSADPAALAKRISQADLHGCCATVIDSNIISLVQKKGIIVKETCKLFVLLTKQNKLLKIPKASQTKLAFAFLPKKHDEDEGGKKEKRNGIKSTSKVFIVHCNSRRQNT